MALGATYHLGTLESDQSGPALKCCWVPASISEAELQEWGDQGRGLGRGLVSLGLWAPEVFNHVLVLYPPSGCEETVDLGSRPREAQGSALAPSLSPASGSLCSEEMRGL